MSKTMLIDSSHEEETRVVIVNDGKVEDLDFESAAKRQLRGNVYLARVTRVEPSLQAAFVEYGGNRHGFLAFPEIHPDYYQIPYEDKLALQQEEEQIAAEAEEDDDIEEDENLDPDENDTTDEDDAEVASEQVKVASTRRKRIGRRRYKIQEVIKRGQILLIQVVKEERGNKGAALTSYLSLAGRYCVLMPNTPRGGGISRKIASASDRKRLKSIMSGLDVPQGMGVIVRTAGAKRNKTEIKRDYEYLSNLWDDIRENTMKSIAPALIHEEGNLVKRSLRDLYNKDIDEVIIEGEEGYKTASNFMQLLMPSHAEFVKEHKSKLPLFLEYGVEKQIEASLDAVVQLKSGGYLVIHPTEALVSIDVNSGRSTKERNVERTALKTNLEAASEVARQMRLRDLAGLIVIDFIDMDEHKNNRAVEKRMKEALAVDRARVQWGKISQFGLMEISRQRRRRSLLEGSTTVCRHCDGVGRKRTVESSALKAVRAIEETAARGKVARMRLKTASDVAHYIVNEKRDELIEIEKSLGTFTEVVGDDELIRPNYDLEIVEKKSGGKDLIDAAESARRKEAKKKAQARAKARKEEEAEEDEEDTNVEARDKDHEDGEDKPRRRRRGRRGGRNRRRKSEDTSETSESSEPDGLEVIEPDAEDDAPKRSRRRRAPAKRGEAKEAEATEDKPKRSRRKAPSRSKSEDEVEVEAEDKPKSTRRRKAPSKAKAASAPKPETVEEEAPSKPKRSRRKAPARGAKAAVDKAEDKPVDAAEDKPASSRRKAAPRKAASKAASAKKPAAKKPASKKAPAKKPAAKKAPAKKAPPKKAAPKKAATPKKAAPKADAEKPAAKPAAKKRTPAARAKAPAKTETKAAPAKKAAPRRKAPAKAKAAEKPAPAKPAAAKPDAEMAKSDAKPKKRGWWNLGRK